MLKSLILIQYRLHVQSVNIRLSVDKQYFSWELFDTRTKRNGVFVDHLARECLCLGLEPMSGIAGWNGVLFVFVERE